MNTIEKLQKMTEALRRRALVWAAPRRGGLPSSGLRGVFRMGDGIMSSLPVLETVVLPGVLVFILLMA